MEQKTTVLPPLKTINCEKAGVENLQVCRSRHAELEVFFGLVMSTFLESQSRPASQIHSSHFAEGMTPEEIVRFLN